MSGILYDSDYYAKKPFEDSNIYNFLNSTFLNELIFQHQEKKFENTSETLMKMPSDEITSLLNEIRLYAMYYHGKEDIEEISVDGGLLRLISGKYKDHEGFRGKYLPVDYYDIKLEPGKSFTIETDKEKSVLVFTLSGAARIAGETVEEKTAVKLTEGDSLVIESLEKEAEILFVSSDMLKEPVSWGGPIVMNTEQELRQAFAELRTGEFLKEKVEYDV